MINDTWIVSPPTVDDLPVIFAIENQSPSPWTLSQLEGELFAPLGLQLTCRRRDNLRITGFILGRIVNDEAEILKISTNSADYRQGVASRLLGEFIKQIKDKGVRKCYLELRSANTPARCLYEKFAFLMTGSRKNYYSDPQDDAVCMTLALF
jgi:ribosomal-protein-alanine N-acetyltransferase